MVIEADGTLKNFSGDTLTIADGTGTDFIINGTYVLYGTQPTFAAGATAVINDGGLVRADDNTSGKSDVFASNTNVLFRTGSVFEWAIITGANVFNTSNTTYFNAPGSASESPVFRINVNLTVGASTTTTFNGRLEIASGKTLTFQNTGIKIFRDGFGGNGIIVHKGGSVVSDNPSGTFKITGSNAIIDGSITLNIENNSLTTNNELEIAQGAVVTISGNPSINIGSAAASGSDFIINGTLKHTGSNPVYLTYGNLTVNGYIDGASTGDFSAGTTTSSITNVTIGSITGVNNSDYAGTLTFTSGYNYVNKWTMQRVISHTNSSIMLGSDVTTNSLVLTKGIAATDDHLFTYSNTGTLTLPTSYSDSYICTCNSSGTEITPTGNNGFRVNNVTGNTDQMFPVGTDFVSPNRIALNMNNVIISDYTVVIGKGDIGGTPLARVNRIWYVSQTYTGSAYASMKLYFTKRNWATYPFGSGQDEIEDGFIYSDPRLIQKNYSGLFVNTSTQATADVPNYTSNITYPYDTEIFGRYYLGISADYQGNYNGINGFARFSVINLSNIILPVKLINFKAYQNGNGVQIDWTALNEINVDHYEIEKSNNGISFIGIARANAVNNGNSVNYCNTDLSPATGNNFYRIKAIDKNGVTTYTSIALVNIGNGKTSINIYPNPVQNRMINIQFTNLPNGKYQLILYNNIGQQIFNRTIEHSGGSGAQGLILPSNTKPGAYIVKLFNETSNFTNRLVIE